MRDPGEVRGASWEHPGTGQVIPIHSSPLGRGQPGISDLTSFIHRCSRPPVKAQGWMGSTSGGWNLQSFLLYCLDLFFSGLSQVLTTQPSIPAGQGRQASRWVCPAAGGGGLWQLVQWLVASRRPGALLCGAVVCNSHLLSNLSVGLG